MSVAEEAEVDQIMADYNDDDHAGDDDGLEFNENDARNIATPQEISQIFGPSCISNENYRNGRNTL